MVGSLHYQIVPTNLNAKASGEDSSITEYGIQDDLSVVHGGQHQVVAWGKSYTEETDSVGGPGEEVGRPRQGELAPEVTTASAETYGLAVERPGKEKERADLERLDKERLDGDIIVDEVADVQ